jgi:hypothetical protein
LEEDQPLHVCVLIGMDNVTVILEDKVCHTRDKTFPVGTREEKNCCIAAAVHSCQLVQQRYLFYVRFGAESV